jgi:hypothetical protein
MEQGLVTDSREPAPVLTDLAHEAANILWSAENGGWNGRPSEVRRILRELITAIEGTT